MKKNSELKTDVEKLAGQSIAAEAEDQVFAVMGRAMGELDAESRELLEDHFGGATVDELSISRGLSRKETEMWLGRTKRELIKRLRTVCTVRQ